MAVSNSITAILNFIIFLSSIPVIAAGIWLASKPDNECIQLLRWPVVVLGGLGGPAAAVVAVAAQQAVVEGVGEGPGP